MYLSPNFTLAEMTVSQEAVRRGILNAPKQEHIANLQKLCNEILEPLRAKIGRPVVVSSGFRSASVNQFVGGSKTSDHMVGAAADIIVPGMTPLQVCQVISTINLPFKQCINEFDAWCHVSIGPHAKRELLSAKRDAEGKVFYLKGLV
jgi:hypothetical protein